jgi:hypothetical protein
MSWCLSTIRIEGPDGSEPPAPSKLTVVVVPSAMYKEEVERYRRRILLAVEPGLLQGALSKLLSARGGDEVVQIARARMKELNDSYSYDVAIVSDDLPTAVHADVVITLPDTRGSGGMGTVRRGGVVQDVSILGAERIVELLEKYAPTDRPPSSFTS